MENNQHNNPEDQNLFGEVISSYSRAQAIEDGVLADISALARECGFKYPVAVTCGVLELLNDTCQPGQSFEGRAWDMLTILRLEIRRSKDTDVVYFAPYFNSKDHGNPVPHKLWSKCGPGDNGEPVITVMLTDED